jgi:hypothetical protein
MDGWEPGHAHMEAGFFWWARQLEFLHGIPVTGENCCFFSSPSLSVAVHVAACFFAASTQVFSTLSKYPTFTRLYWMDHSSHGGLLAGGSWRATGGVY